jgi:hypothetical protein
VKHLRCSDECFGTFLEWTESCLQDRGLCPHTYEDWSCGVLCSSARKFLALNDAFFWFCHMHDMCFLRLFL